MQHLSRRSSKLFATLALVCLSALPVMNHALPAQAQQTHSWVHKHHKLVGIGAGFAAYKMAKISGRNRAAHGGRKNFAQRHPILTGIGAGLVANHMAKKHQ